MKWNKIVLNIPKDLISNSKEQDGNLIIDFVEKSDISNSEKKQIIITAEDVTFPTKSISSKPKASKTTKKDDKSNGKSKKVANETAKPTPNPNPKRHLTQEKKTTNVNSTVYEKVIPTKKVQILDDFSKYKKFTLQGGQNLIIPKSCEYVEGKLNTGFIFKNNVDGSIFATRAIQNIDFGFHKRNFIFYERLIPRKTIKAISTSVYSENYKNPIIPDGFVYSKGTWNTGFVIKNKKDKSEFVWIPVGFLEADGTLDGINFNERFGERIFSADESFGTQNYRYHDKADTEFFESVKRYGGFYLSAFVASEEKDQIVFRKGREVLRTRTWKDANKYAEEYAKDNPNIVACLPSGAAYDSVLKWIIQANKKTLYEVAIDASSWGNFAECEGIDLVSRRGYPTGSNQKWCVFNIYDLAGNFSEWTTERMYAEICKDDKKYKEYIESEERYHTLDTSLCGKIKYAQIEQFVARGDDYLNFGYSASIRYGQFIPTTTYQYGCSFRCAFYVK